MIICKAHQERIWVTGSLVTSLVDCGLVSATMKVIFIAKKALFLYVLYITIARGIFARRNPCDLGWRLSVWASWSSARERLDRMRSSRNGTKVAFYSFSSANGTPRYTPYYEKGLNPSSVPSHQRSKPFGFWFLALVRVWGEIQKAEQTFRLGNLKI